MHAAFLLVFASLSFVGSVTGSRVFGGSYFPYLVNLLAGGAIGLAVALAKVWLLGNFDRRGARFHRDAVIGLLATVILSGYAKVLIADLIGYAEGPYLAVLPWLDVVFGLAAFAVTDRVQTGDSARVLGASSTSYACVHLKPSPSPNLRRRPRRRARSADTRGRSSYASRRWRRPAIAGTMRVPGA